MKSSYLHYFLCDLLPQNFEYGQPLHPLFMNGHILITITIVQFYNYRLMLCGYIVV
jgi:hypothetical protein